MLEAIPDELVRSFIEALLFDRGGWHAHRCGNCGEVWEHEDLAGLVPGDEYHRRHNCPACGTNQRRKMRVNGKFDWPEPLGIGGNK